MTDPAAPTDRRVVVLAGGLSHERDVSLRSGRRAAQALRDVGFEVTELDVTAGLLSRLTEMGSPVVVPMLHGGAGEDGALRQAFEMAGIPYVGSSAGASRMTFDKSVATAICWEAGLKVPHQVFLTDDLVRELGAPDLMAALTKRLGFPMVVKPARGGSSLGVAKVDQVDDLPQALVKAYGYGRVAVVEQFIAGTEVAVTVLDTGSGPRALPAVEIRPDRGVYDFQARYTAGETRFLAPAELTDDVAERCAALALAAHEALGLDGLSRTDMIVDESGEPVFLEANVAPGMTETSLVPLALDAAGLDLGQVLADLVAVAPTYDR